GVGRPTYVCAATAVATSVVTVRVLRAFTTRVTRLCPEVVICGAEVITGHLRSCQRDRVEEGRGSLRPMANTRFPSPLRTCGPDFRNPTLRPASLQGPTTRQRRSMMYGVYKLGQR